MWFKRKGARVDWDGEVASVANQRIVKLRDVLTAPPIDAALKSGSLTATEADSFENGLNKMPFSHADLISMPQITGMTLIRQMGVNRLRVIGANFGAVRVFGIGWTFHQFKKARKYAKLA